ncbi:MAG: peptide deformylase [Anaerolineales bacterium]|nr:peptide deformylase [Anaerolineales bacterium]
MAIREIVTLPHPVLRQRARPVTDFGPELQNLIDDMVETLRSAPGVGLAANQVAVPAQVIIVEMPISEMDGSDEDPSPSHTGELFELVNPSISWHSRETVDGVEGCLSLPGLAGQVERYHQVRVEAKTRHGKKFRMRFGGWLARIFQHEIDHLHGVLFIDHISDPELIWPIEPGTEEEVEAQAAGKSFSD